MYASSRRSTLISGLVHIAVIVLLLMSGGVVPTPSWEPEHISLVLPSDLVKYAVTTTAHDGGGGGTKDLLPPTKGHTPKAALHAFVPPTARIENQQPVLTMEQAIVADPSIQIPKDLPLIGDPNGVLGVKSNGPGKGSGIGAGENGGDGPGHGPGAGDGDGGIGGSRNGFRDNVSQPELIWKSEPEYTEEARKVKLQGTVQLRIVVDERGRAESIEVTHGLGLGLDERAVAAVRQWKFKPGMRGGKPVPTVAIIQVSFRLL